MIHRSLKYCIPINFLGGSGGSFLCSFLTAAKYNKQVKFEFSEYSGMHTQRYNDIPTHVHGPEESLAKKLRFIRTSPRVKKIHWPPYFTTIHVPDTNDIIQYFDKLIHINFDDSDVNDIACCFLLKKDSKIDQNLLTIRTSFINRYPMYRTIIENNKVLNISWKELLYGDTGNLIFRLSQFAEIPSSNFNIDNLIRWRSGTKETIELGNKYIIGG